MCLWTCFFGGDKIFHFLRFLINRYISVILDTHFLCNFFVLTYVVKHAINDGEVRIWLGYEVIVI